LLLFGPPPFLKRPPCRGNFGGRAEAGNGNRPLFFHLYFTSFNNTPVHPAFCPPFGAPACLAPAPAPPSKFYVKMTSWPSPTPVPPPPPPRAATFFQTHRSSLPHGTCHWPLVAPLGAAPHLAAKLGVPWPHPRYGFGPCPFLPLFFGAPSVVPPAPPCPYFPMWCFFN